jgi:outer membrane protein assembly factor BamE (lipoprotein component of BamABCDE complex)
MLADPFNPQRWDYIYTLQRGREKGRDRGHFIVWFEGDKVSRVEKPGLAVLPQVNEQQKTPPEVQAPAPTEGIAPARPPVAAVEQSPPAPKPDGTTN